MQGNISRVIRHIASVGSARIVTCDGLRHASKRQDASAIGSGVEAGITSGSGIAREIVKARLDAVADDCERMAQ